ncbi:ketopantoate reductase family protein [Clostridium sp. MT-14]|mgnify:FL=1|jgi:2-dehydropantoate 2-reductase|uniref:2-dehydropantoate 2-reductase n=1 Tax=Clostridium aromativorans TaxID=2836848 RepID=A0ABS8N600_9CLOT|nr:2-dehydropantoate 2-reductase [Clostridium aromativorans]MCC9295227.1 2-dehydropantoate 2-reductase [Clostridium aromativorans]
MKIAIIGAGAMGSLYGGYLSRVSSKVYLVDVWQQHVDAINEEGLKIDEKDHAVIVKPEAVNDAASVGPVDLAIIFVKSINTPAAMEKNAVIFGPNTLILSLQNGYGNIEKIAKYADINNIIAGTTAHGATMIEPAHIKHAGCGETNIGWAKSKNDKRIYEISEVLNSAGFKTVVSDNVMELIWSKLIINVGINALTAILKLKNGDLLAGNETKDLMRMSVNEAVKVAKAKGTEFNGSDMVKKVMDVAFATSENKSSMLQDILNGRKTEIDTINGAIVNEGEKFSIDTPVNLILTNLVKALEKSK